MKIDLRKMLKTSSEIQQLSRDIKKGWGSKKKKPVEQKPPSMSQAEKDRIRIAKKRKLKSKMYPPKKTKPSLRKQHTNEVLKDMGMKPLGYWAKEMERFID